MGRFAAAAFVALAAMTGFAQAWPKLEALKQPLYDAVWAPQVVAVPFTHAGPESISVNDAGEIMTGGGLMIGGKRTQMSLVSRDCGLNWEKSVYRTDSWMPPKCPWTDYRLNVGGPGGDADKTKGFCWRLRKNAAGKYAVEHRSRVPGAVSYGHLRALPKNRRWLYVTSESHGVPGCVAVRHPSICISADDGATWRNVQITNIIDVVGFREPDKAQRWRVGCQEPDVVELNDGTLLLMTRASTDHHVFYFSKDGGDTWSEPRELPAFWSHNTMPFVMRLNDGRILAIWNNTQILPEMPTAAYPELGATAINGCWEWFFTNRDALHAAISEDDGRTWIGFREIALNDIRNREDYREVGNEFWSGNIDKSVHQEHAVELPGGKILVHYGQNEACQRLAVFDVKWLYETSRAEDLRRGTGNLSNFLYLKSLADGFAGWSGHCALNRIPGASMVREPDTDRNTRREALQICRVRDARLVSEKQGVVWNFPAAKRGEVEFECRIDGAGVLVSLCDHWINPCDWAIRERAMSAVDLTASQLGGNGLWKAVKVAWNLGDATVTLSVDGRETKARLRTEGFSPYGVSYLHLQTLAEGPDAKGTYIRWFKMRATDAPKVVSHRADNRTGFEFYQDVAVKKNGKDNAVNLYVVDASGDERQLTFGCHHDYCPALSPDGQTVYFSSTRAVDPAVHKGPYTDGAGIASVPLAGGTPRALVLCRTPGCACIDPTPSPDGAALVWAETADFRSSYRLMRAPLADFSKREPLTDEKMSAHSPKWIDEGTLEFVGYRAGDPGWMRYRMNLGNKALRRMGPADYASKPSGEKYVPVPKVAAKTVYQAPAFEKIALVDSYDFLTVFDLQKPASCSQVVDHVLLTGADSLLWRQQSGGMPRYLTAEENRTRIPWPNDKLRSPINSPSAIFTDLCLNLGYDHVLGGLDAIRARGKGAGIHYTWEEAHWSNSMLNQWTIEHPQFWGRTAAGNVWMGHASIAFPEVVEHRLRQIDELVAMGADTFYVDATCRCGGYSPAYDYVPPVLAEWKKLYGNEPVPSSRYDTRWFRLTSRFYHDFFRQMRARLDASGRKIRLIITTKEALGYEPLAGREGGTVGLYTLRNHGYDWVELAKAGVIDGVAVDTVSLHADKRDCFEETEEIYRGVKKVAGDLPVYFPVMNYNFGGWKSRPGYPEYAKLAKISNREAVARLIKLAKDCGGAGITMECVDYRNYESVADVIRDAR